MNKLFDKLYYATLTRLFAGLIVFGLTLIVGALLLAPNDPIVQAIAELAGALVGLSIGARIVIKRF